MMKSGNIHTARSWLCRLVPGFEAVSRFEALLSPSFASVHRRVNALKSNPSHKKPLKIRRKLALCEGGECFFGELFTYIHARIGHRQNRLRPMQRDRTSSPFRLDNAWSPPHKSRTCSHNSRTCKNNSWTCKNNSRTYGKNTSSPLHLFTSETQKITADSNSDGGGVSRSQQADIFTMTPHKFFNFTLFYRLNLSKRKRFLIFI